MSIMTTDSEAPSRGARSAMSSNAAPSYIEGNYRLIFEPSAQVCRLECSAFYSQRAQNFCTSCKEVDFILYLPRTRELWLVELKDYRGNPCPQIHDLADSLCRKVRDTLFLLQIASNCAPDEHPIEGISLRQMGLLSQAALKIRLAFGIEIMDDPELKSSMLMSVREKLERHLHIIDPQLLCLPISQLAEHAPWHVCPSQGELSPKLRQRMQQESHHASGKKPKQRLCSEDDLRRQREMRAARRAAHRALPRWKQRAIERAHGYTGTHLDREQFLKDM